MAESSNFRGKVTKYTYTGDSYARITCVEDPLGNKTWTNYDTECRSCLRLRFPVSTVDARGSGPDDEDHMTKNEYDANGNLISVTDPLGSKTTYLYDGSGKLISQTDPTGWVTYYNTDDDSSSTEVKDALGRVISSTDKDGKTTNYQYDIDSHLIKITDPNGAISTNTYDTIGRMEASSDFEGNITRYEYDVMGRTTKTTAPDGGETSYQYDVKGRITKTTYPDESTTETTYDIYGNVKTTTDRAGNVNENFYDRLNRVIKIKDPAGNYTYYDYDENGNRTAVRDPRSSGPDDDTYKISYTYDDNDRLTRTDYPDETYETIGYDEVGNVTSRTDRKGQTTTYAFDNANRLTQITYHDSTYMKYNYDAAGRTINREDPDGSITYCENHSTFRREFKLDSGESLVYDYYWIYDDNGRLSRFMDCTEAVIAKYDEVKYRENVNIIGYSSTAILGQNFKYGEEGAGNRKYRQGTPDSRIRLGKIKCGIDGIQYGSAPGVLVTGYNYDDDGTLASMTDPYGREFSFNSVSGKSRTDYPNNTFTERTFDQYGRLSAIIHKRTNNGAFPDEYGSETTLESFAYDYDDNGNITRITYANGEYTDYTYDSLNRLTKEEKKTASEETIYKIEYKFDDNQAKNGNIHQVTVNNTDTTTFTYDEMNQLTAITHPDSSIETLTYDDNGNLVQTTRNDEITSYEWDCFDRLTKVTLPAKGGGTAGEIMELDYDSDGMLVRQKDVTVPGSGGTESQGTERKYIQNNRYATRELVKNRQGEWEPTATHIIHGTMLASYLNSTSVKPGSDEDMIFYHTDHLNSVRLITDKNGNIVDNPQTDGYGNPIPIKSEIPQNFCYIGKLGIRFAHQINFYNMRARWYRSQFYRFISTDPLRENESNAYSYANNNPTRYIDFTGKEFYEVSFSEVFSLVTQYNNWNVANTVPKEEWRPKSLESDSFFACLIFCESHYERWPKETEWNHFSENRRKVIGLMQLNTISAQQGMIDGLNKVVKEYSVASATGFDVKLNEMEEVISATPSNTKPTSEMNVAGGIYLYYYKGSLEGYGTHVPYRPKIRSCEKCMNKAFSKLGLLIGDTEVNILKWIGLSIWKKDKIDCLIKELKKCAKIIHPDPSW